MNGMPLNSITGNPEFIREIPKTDLHLHLDGSIRLPTLLELAEKQGTPLPCDTEEELKRTVFRDHYNNLSEYLSGFRYTIQILQDYESLARVAREIAEDNQAEGVRYIEVRFAPQLHVNAGLSLEDALLSVNEGLASARKEFNAKPGVKSGKEPPFHYGIIVCALREFSESQSHYFRQFSRIHTYTTGKALYSMASLELARASVAIRDRRGIPVVGFDLAGPEHGFPPSAHAAAYEFAHRHFLKKTVHAGEDYGPESIFQAITDLHADRIGHGYHLFDVDMVRDPSITDRAQYVESLAEYIADRRITLEVCLTSNYQTIPKLRALSEHNFRRMLSHRLSMTLCTDNRTVSHTTVCDEIARAVKDLNVNSKQLRDLVIYGFKRSFFPGTYLEKRLYVRKVIDYYQRIEEKYGNQG
jgi:adenosine deaminase